MTESPAAPAPMEEHGGYNLRSRVQAGGLSPAVPLLEHAAQTAALPEAPQSIVIADYGSSQGHNSLAPMGAAISALRERGGAERAISVVHTDLPRNDFAALFETLLNDPASYLRDNSNVYPSAVGRSFYEQLLPSESVTLGWSSWAIQWLSAPPCPIPDHVQVASSRDAAAREAFRRRSAEDWRNFLAARGRELRPGGKLVVITMALDEHGEFGYRPLLAAMYDALTAMVESGFIRAEELHRMTIPTVARSREDFLAPFGSSGSFSGLRVEEIEVFNGEDHIWADYEKSGKTHSDARTYAAQWVAFSRASVFPTMAEALDTSTDNGRRARFFDTLEAESITRLAKSPERMLTPLAKMLLAKA